MPRRKGIWSNTMNDRFALVAVASFLILSIMGIGASKAFGATPNLTVATKDIGGATLNGYWISVTTTSGATVQTGFSPGQFSLSTGSYLVAVGDYGGEYFNHWSDGTTARSHPVTISSTGSVSLTAVYCPSTGCGGSTISVQSTYADGTALAGMYTTIAQGSNTIASGFTPTSFSTISGQSYTITVSDYTNAYFNHWSNGYGVRSITVTATTS